MVHGADHLEGQESAEVLKEGLHEVVLQEVAQVDLQEGRQAVQGADLAMNLVVDHEAAGQPRPAPEEVLGEEDLLVARSCQQAVSNVSKRGRQLGAPKVTVSLFRNAQCPGYGTCCLQHFAGECVRSQVQW